MPLVAVQCTCCRWCLSCPPPFTQVHVAAYVSHIVAKYERGVVAKLVEKLYGEAAGGRGNGRLC